MTDKPRVVASQGVIGDYETRSPSDVNIDIDALEKKMEEGQSEVTSEETNVPTEEVSTTETEAPDEEEVSNEEEEATETEEEIATEEVEEQVEEGEQPKLLELSDVDDTSWQNLSKLRSEGKAGPSIIKWLKSTEPEIQAKFREAKEVEKNAIEKLAEQMALRDKQDAEFKRQEFQQKQDADRRRSDAEMAELKETDPEAYNQRLIAQKLENIEQENAALKQRVAQNENTQVYNSIKSGIDSAVSELKNEYPYMSDKMAKKVAKETHSELILRWDSDRANGLPMATPVEVATMVFKDLDSLVESEIEEQSDSRPSIAKLKQQSGKQGVDKVFKKKKQGSKTVPSTKQADPPEIKEKIPELLHGDVSDIISTEDLIKKINKQKQS